MDDTVKIFGSVVIPALVALCFYLSYSFSKFSSYRAALYERHLQAFGELFDSLSEIIVTLGDLETQPNDRDVGTLTARIFQLHLQIHQRYLKWAAVLPGSVCTKFRKASATLVEELVHGRIQTDKIVEQAAALRAHYAKAYGDLVPEARHTLKIARLTAENQTMIRDLLGVVSDR